MFLMDAQQLALDKMVEFKLIEKGWTFGWIRSKNTCGQCSPSRKLITLSESYVVNNNETEVGHTILHEIAHALAYLVDGTCAHNTTWKTICVAIGIPPLRLHDLEKLDTYRNVMESSVKKISKKG